jgi:hypothetical protein
MGYKPAHFASKVDISRKDIKIDRHPNAHNEESP